jgi:hypothetical protein
MSTLHNAFWHTLSTFPALDSCSSAEAAAAAATAAAAAVDNSEK